jgi:hypothetical protein
MNINFTANYPIKNFDELENYLKIPRKFNGITVNFFYKENYVNIWFHHNSFVLEIDNDNEFDPPSVYKELGTSFDVVDEIKKFFEKIDKK